MTVTATGEYRAIQSVNWSTLKQWRISPRAGHYYETTAEAVPDSDALRLGRAIHVAVLEPEKFQTRFARWDGGRRAGKEWIAYCDALDGRDSLTPDQWDTALAVAAAVRTHPAAARWIEAPGREVETVRRWYDRKSETACKARLDLVPASGVVVDLKSARTIDFRRFQSQAWDLGYFHQIAFYRRGQAAKTSADPQSITGIIIGVETAPPYDVIVIDPVRADTLEDCDAEIDELLKRRAECNAARVWPGRYPEPVEMGAPAYAFASADGADEMTMTIGGDNA